MTDLHYDFLRRLLVEVDEELSERVGERVLIVGGTALIFAGLRRGRRILMPYRRYLPVR